MTSLPTLWSQLTEAKQKKSRNQGLFEGEGHGQIVSIVVCF